METYKEQPESQTDKEAKVYRLNIDLADMTAKKRSTMKAYNEELKRIKAEIKDIISPEQETFDIA